MATGNAQFFFTFLSFLVLSSSRQNVFVVEIFIRTRTFYVQQKFITPNNMRSDGKPSNVSSRRESLYALVLFFNNTRITFTRNINATNT
jgi:hypothetical protein